MTVEEVLAELGVSLNGLTSAEASAREDRFGPNAVRTHHVRAWVVLARQFRSALLLLLAGTAIVSALLGSHTDALIIGVILLASVGLGFVNEYRAERTAEALRSAVRHTATAVRDGHEAPVDVTLLVPGDVVRLPLGAIVPADIRLVTAHELACDESALTGESVPVDKDVTPVATGTALADLTSCALMGTVVHAGMATGVVVATGPATEFGRLALDLGERDVETAFQTGLRQFSVLLLRVALVLTVLIFVTNLALERPLLDAAMFSLAIAVGITPQLLPAVVSTSLAAGSRRLARQKVLVKRLVCIEDLGDMDTLVTDKTGTLTEGRIRFLEAVAPDGRPDPDAVTWGLLATGDGARPDTTQGAAEVLDQALRGSRTAPGPETLYTVLDVLPFDHERRLTTTLVRAPDGQHLLAVKGAPESVLARCTDVPPAAADTLERLARSGSRVIAVATRVLDGRPDGRQNTVSTSDETCLSLRGYLVFLDAPKPDATASLERLRTLNVAVKVATGDHPLVAERVCADLGVQSGGTLVGPDIDAMSDDDLAAAADRCGIFARVTPEQKARIVRLLRQHGRAVGFLGDGVNDALALHAADVGISVDTAVDVAKDAADIVLLEKNLAVLADGVAGGRRIFANTIKYVLMGTSSNFGNMFSAAAASSVLPFLPMLPSQILLNNLLYDAGQLSIPTDNVDDEQLHAPSHWDIRQIRRFMLFFGPLSSLFDFMTYAVMLGIFQAGPDLFRSGWFVESLATQTLVIFAIRTRRVPFFTSHPSLPLALSAVGVVVTGVVLPGLPAAAALGFAPLPPGFFLALLAMVAAYLVLVEFGKVVFFRNEQIGETARKPRTRVDRVHRRAAKFSHPGALPSRQP